jgi:hypothetical protein
MAEIALLRLAVSMKNLPFPIPKQDKVKEYSPQPTKRQDRRESAS